VREQNYTIIVFRTQANVEDPKVDNYMEIFEDWNFALRIYQPVKAYFDGSWKKPELVEAK